LKKSLLAAALLTSSLLSANITQLKSLESNFKQSIVNDQNSRITYKGKMYATKENNQALWIYTTPIEKKIYYKNGSIVIIEPELEQVIFAKLSKVPNVLTLLNGAKKISQNKLQTTFNNIKYTITTEGNKIKSINYTDEIQNRVIIEFNSQMINGSISSNTFNYSIPEDYDILEQ
jgi:outer membrane lipoprotein carrier protein